MSENNIDKKISNLKSLQAQFDETRKKIEQKASEVRQRQEEITKWISIDTKISELKSLQVRLNEAKKNQEIILANKKAIAEKKIQEANLLMNEAVREKTKAQKDMSTVTVERNALQAERNKFKAETEQGLSKITEAKADLIKEQRKLEGLQNNAEVKTRKLNQQEQKTLAAIEALNITQANADQKMAELKNLQETQQAELNAKRQALEEISAKNEATSKETVRQQRLLEITKAENQKILDETNVAKAEILAKEKRVANMLNRQADIQLELDERERKIKEKEPKQ